ncbi:ABC transporter ATP-binding protein [Eggerthellaceae bacterium zg-1084]|uniref:ABC transporter ATP-binding protein n=1 Tax=Berryella wangjianweii TaxID=2734634 RepID=UPI001555CA3C|nr:ATP-binding cassette domain-containing protein [Berryella wangjianweii]NPD31007.1 ABC transporter ATP-binding protein [Berryella wangjianweii]
MSPVVIARDLRRVFAGPDGAAVTAVDGVSFQLGAGECLGLVGASGSGKSTVAALVMGFDRPTAGSVQVHGREVRCDRGPAARRQYRHIQMVFQQPQASFDPRRTLGQGIAESLMNASVAAPAARERAEELLTRCGLPAAFADRYPHQVSGGQCQRAAIARALASEPSVLVCDEATSALDMTAQSQVMELLADIRGQRQLALLFISHDMALVQQVCDRVLVMSDGRIVEEGPTAHVIGNPQHPYTQALIDAVL